MKFGCAVFTRVSGGVGVAWGWGGVAICPKSWGGGSGISIEDFLSPFSIFCFLGFGKIVIFLPSLLLGASIVVVMIMRVIKLID
jgi:hypothetical protein